MSFAGILGLISATLWLALAVGCGEQGDERAAALEKQAAGAAREAGETLEANTERSAKIMKETYDEQRKAGEGAVTAAGDAYEAVLEEPIEREEAEEQ
jgi:hypothetical protein